MVENNVIEGRYFERENKLKVDQLETAYEYLAGKRTLFLHGIICNFMMRPDAFGAAAITDLMLALDSKSNERINLIIDSPGGMVTSGFILYDTMRTIQSPIRTIGRSCQSMAAVILAAGSKGERYVYPSSRVMLHLPSGQVTGDAKDIEIQQKELNMMKDQIVDALIACGVKKTRKQILRDIDREYWLSAEETVKYGLADRIVESGFKF